MFQSHIGWPTKENNSPRKSPNLFLQIEETSVRGKVLRITGTIKDNNVLKDASTQIRSSHKAL